GDREEDDEDAYVLHGWILRVDSWRLAVGRESWGGGLSTANRQLPTQTVVHWPLMHKRVSALLGILLLCASCQKFAEGRQIFHDLLALRDQLATRFNEKVVDVSISGGDGLT